jgi:cysteine-rich repeat protein
MVISRVLRILCLGALGIVLAACPSSQATQCEVTGILCPPQTHCAAAEPVCIADTNLCGNAHMDPGEICDDGNTKDGDECAHDCTSTLQCGNGIRDINAKVPELCDDGNTKDGDGCSHDCLSLEECGNGIVDVGEICDDGNDVAGDGCSHSCQSNETCGNSIVDPGEACDLPGDLVHCSADCLSTLNCGNFSVDPGEECDLRIKDSNGNVIVQNSNSADCRADCIQNRCGDGYKNVDGSGPGHLEHVEECDDALPVDQRPQGSDPREVIPTETATCNFDCTTPTCGDGQINRHFKPDNVHVEECDDGNANSNSAKCTLNCQINVCGDGKKNPATEACDNGPLNGTVGNPCTANCTLVNCPNGVLDAGEQCDDGANSGPGKRCNLSCKFNVCGDGDTQTGVEQCDGGNGSPRDTASCDLDCTDPVCGDGHKNTQAGEECDDGADNGTLGSTCSASCKLITCGNGVREQNEACDAGLNGVKKDSATCDFDCSLPSCGDGHKNTLAGEDCDDGVNNGTAGSTCSATCRSVSCGNGDIEQNEECDDGKDGQGNNNNHAGARCNGQCKINVCGDNDKLVGIEQCDPGGGAGTPADTATCDSDCTFAVCGDNHKNTVALEACDDGNKNGTAQSPNNCNAFCKINSCGNGTEDVGEECDPGGGSNPQDTATCNADCTLSRCGDGHTNAADNEICDEGVTNGDPCPYNNPTCQRCSSTCTAKINPGGQFCGDGIKQTGQGEACDPGGGFPSTDSAACDNDCTPAVCGDGHTNTPKGELCDDFNDDPCGTCAAGCTAAITPANAVGSIKTAAVLNQGNVKDGDTITLSDGIHATPTVFEFDVAPSNTVGPGHIAISVIGTDNAGAVAVALRNAVNSVGATLDIDAVVGGANGDIVTLTNSHGSSLGNTTIQHTGPGTIDASFTFTDFAGGKAGNCSQGTPCLVNADCVSNNCSTTTHKCL